MIIRFPRYPPSINFPLATGRIPQLELDIDPSQPRPRKGELTPNTESELSLEVRALSSETGDKPKTPVCGLPKARRVEFLRRLVTVYDEMGKATWSPNPTPGPVPESVRFTAAILLTIPPELRIPGLGDFRRWEMWLVRALWGDFSAPDGDPPLGSILPQVKEKTERRQGTPYVD